MQHEIIHADGEKLAIPVPENYRDCALLVRSDYYRHSGCDKPLWKVFFNGLSRISIGFSFWFRMSQHKGWAFPFTCFMLRRYKHRYGLFVPRHTRIGYGLYIQHCCGLVINKRAVIGNNVNLGQFTTIGSNVERAAIIGNNVYVGPNTCIVDDVVVHSRTTIGAGAVVTRNVPTDTTVAGVPAKSIGIPHHDEYIRNPWPINITGL